MLKESKSILSIITNKQKIIPLTPASIEKHLVTSKDSINT